MSKKDEEKKDLQFITVNDKKVYEIDDTLDLGEHSHNVRLIEDYKDGRLLVEHSYYTDRGKTFLGNVKTVIFTYDDQGTSQFKAELDTPKANKIKYDRNRQALQDSKNTARGDATRESKADPNVKVGRAITKKLKEGSLTLDKLIAAGIDIEELGLTK